MASHEPIPDYRAFDPSKRPKRLTGAYLVLAGALIGVLAMNRFAPRRMPTEGEPAPPDTPYTQTAPVNPSTAALAHEEMLITAAEKALPAVVSVYSSGVKTFSYSNPLFRRLQRNFNKRISNMGSGVIVDHEGTIYTNDHVIDTGRNVRITVALSDGRRFIAKLVKRFQRQDIAVLSIDGDNLPFIEIAPSRDVRPGQTVLAIGNPFGAGLTEGLTGGEPTVTRGIISATNRVLFPTSQEGIDRYYQHLFQTDASINEGNSGGALVDIHGRLIGINTAILEMGGGSLGIGFAIPTDRIGLFIDHAARYGNIDGWKTGIQIQQLSPNIAEALGYQGNGGALVSKVDPESSGDASGVKRSDIIVGINGYNVITTEHVQNMFHGFVTGETLMLTVIRDGERIELPITLEPQD